MATAADVMTASDTMQSAKTGMNPTGSRHPTPASVCSQPWGSDTSADIAIGSVPLPDLSAIDVVDFNTDVEQLSATAPACRMPAIQSRGNRNGDFGEIRSGKSGQRERCVPTQSLYEQLKAAKLQYEGAEAAYQSASITYASRAEKAAGRYAEPE